MVDALDRPRSLSALAGKPPGYYAVVMNDVHNNEPPSTLGSG